MCDIGFEFFTRHTTTYTTTIHAYTFTHVIKYTQKRYWLITQRDADNI